MSKLSRHKAILELLHESPVPSQEELQRLLHRRGFDAGQATLSRDIRELGLVKSADGYALPGGEAAAWPTVFRECSPDVRQTQSRCARRHRLFRSGIDAPPPAPSAGGEARPPAPPRADQRPGRENPQGTRQTAGAPSFSRTRREGWEFRKRKSSGYFSRALGKWKLSPATAFVERIEAAGCEAAVPRDSARSVSCAGS